MANDRTVSGPTAAGTKCSIPLLESIRQEIHPIDVVRLLQKPVWNADGEKPSALGRVPALAVLPVMSNVFSQSTVDEGESWSS
jgi:hypothetical protein